jgi:hypothetical protein
VVRLVLIITIVGIAGYLAFLATVDVPMYLSRWRADVANGTRPLSYLEGVRDVSVRWVVTHDLAEWKDEIAWMSLYFSAAVWAQSRAVRLLLIRRLFAALSHRRDVRRALRVHDALAGLMSAWDGPAVLRRHA